MEWEETVLRPAAEAFGNKGGENGDGGKKLGEAIAALDRRIKNCGGETVCPGSADSSSSSSASSSSSTLTVVDLCIAATLHPLIPHSSLLSPSSSPLVSSYLSRVTSSSPYKRALSSCSQYVTPVSPSPYASPLLLTVSHLFLTAVHGAYPVVLATTFPDLKVSASRVTAKGVCADFQCTSALEIYNHFKVLSAEREEAVKAGRQVSALPYGFTFPKNPRECALKIADNVDCGNVLLAGGTTRPTVAGAGYVNVVLGETFLKQRLSDVLSRGVRSPVQKRQKVAVDFSSPNIAKEMHVGHLRSTIIGESVCRILEFAGHDVERINHVGDWGTQFGMLIEYLKDTQGGEASSSSSSGGGGAASANIADLTNFYKAAKAKFDKDESFKLRSQRSVVSLQRGDKECISIWQSLCDTSRKEFKKVYDRLGVTVHECGESFYNSRIPATNAELADRGLVSDSNGAQCVFVPGFNFPLMIRKSDGGYGYDSTDMAALSYRLKEMKADRLVYITDYSQGEHFQLCFKAAAMAGWWNETSHSLQHIGFGTVNGEDGKRFATRSGTTIRLVDLLDEACSRMEKSLRERAAEGKGADFSQEELLDTAAKIGYGAVKYFDLSKNPTSNYKFDFDAMLDTKGNTGVYQMFAIARLASIIDKGKGEHKVDLKGLIHGLPDNLSMLSLAHPAERALAFEVLQFTDMLSCVILDLSPNKICDYLYDLAAKATTFVTDCRVLGSEEMKSRLLLCEATCMIMRKCFELLGMAVPARV